MSKRSGIFQSFGYAFEGMEEAFKSEPNFRVHFAFAITTIVAAYFLKFGITEWAILVLTISLVLIMELINTVIEKVVDIASPGTSRKAKAAKDISAAAVLLSAIAAVIIGLALFVPKVF